MKRIFLLVAVVMIAGTALAQKFEVKSGAGGFNVDGPGIVETTEYLECDGESFVIWKSDKGAKFIKCLSATTGNLYPVWIGRETEHEFEGRKVYQMKSGTYCVYKVSQKTGNPYAIYLKITE